MLGALWICAVGLGASEQADLKALVDQIRRDHGLPAVRLNTALQKAAEAHIQYMRANNTTGHSQSPDNKQYLARTPGERARHFGYVGANSEAVAWGDFGVREMLAGLFDAPYHRTLFLQPASPDFGASFSSGALCVKFGGPSGNGAVVSPHNGARNVTTSWDGIETPDPLRQTNVRGRVGYPIVLAVFGSDAQDFKFVASALVGQSGPVRAIVLHPGNDRQAKNCIIIVPERPLAASATYTATLTYRNTKGEHTARTTFSTAR